LVTAGAGFSTFTATAAQRKLAPVGVAVGTESFAGYYTAEDFPYVIFGPYASFYQSVSAPFPRTRSLFASGTEGLPVGTARIDGLTGAYTLESTEESTGTFSFTPAGDFRIRDFGATTSKNSVEQLGLSQSYVDQMGSGVFRKKDGATFSTTGKTELIEAGGAGTEHVEPLTFVGPTQNSARDIFWSVLRNRSSTQF
jgi:hypothetical protein